MEQPQKDKAQVEQVAKALLKNFPVRAFFDPSNGAIEWLDEPAPEQMDLVLPLVMNELKLVPRKLRPVTKGLFLFGPGIRVQIFKGYDGTLTISGSKVAYDELKRAMFRLQDERERPTIPKAEQE